MTDGRTPTPFFHLSQVVGRTGGTRVDLRRWAYAGLVLALLGLAGWLYLEQATEVASYGYEVRRLQDEKERLRRELTSLRAQVAVAGSLERLEALGAELGYVLPEATDPARRLVVSYRLPEEEAAGDAANAGGAANAGSADVGGEVPSLEGRVRGLVGRLGEWFGVEPSGAHAP
jgi:hypothetical protein